MTFVLTDEEYQRVQSFVLSERNDKLAGLRNLDRIESEGLEPDNAERLREVMEKDVYRANVILDLLQELPHTEEAKDRRAF